LKKGIRAPLTFERSKMAFISILARRRLKRLVAQDLSA
jgi:hypothetical protein